MPISTVPVTGDVVLPDGAAFGAATLVFTLSQPDTESGIVVSGETSVDLDGASIPDDFELWRNTAGIRGTTWLVKVLANVTLANGEVVRRPYPLGRVQTGAAASYTLAELLDNPVPAEPSWNINLMGEETWRARGSVNPLDFGPATGSDDTSLVTAAHATANTENVPVSLVGIADLYVDADAQFAAYTSLDGAGCVVHFVDGTVTLSGSGDDEDLEDDELGFDDALIAWTFSDPDTGLVETIVDVGSDVGEIASTSLKLRSQYPVLGAWDGPGYAKIESGGTVVAANRRGATGTMKYRQAFSLSEHGKSVTGLHANLSSDTRVTLWRRANSERGQLTVSNLTLDITDCNALRAINIARNNCIVEGVSVVGTTATFSRHNLLRYDDVCDQIIKDFHARAFLNDPNKASRLINVVGGANFRHKNVTAFDGWGIVGTQQAQNFFYSSCTLNRIDIHNWGGDIDATDTDFEGYGITYGVVSGDITTRGCRFNNTKGVIAKRKDWAGECFDTIFTVDGAAIRFAEGSATVIDMSTWPAGSTETSCRLPDIAVRNIERLPEEDGLGAVTTTDVVAIKVSDTSLDVYAPTSIVVDGVTVPPLGRVQALAWPSEDLEPCDTGTATKVTISNIRARNVSGALAGSTVYGRPSAKTATGASAIYTFHRCDALTVENPTDAGGTEYYAWACNIARFKVGQRATHLDGCTYTAPLFVSPETAAQIGGPPAGGSGNNYTAISGGRVVANDFDFSNALAISGLLTRNHTPTWPTGCTSALAWSGFKHSSF
jgi:hypothetical protein